ncbi:hypothetical protein FACS1894208_11900 [Clostridia bacterium]|nr:hypothetical protein FACS1894208_11900 [Clostridia bacterium]
MVKQYVIDACALVALFENENGADFVEAMLAEANLGNIKLRMSKLNLLEVYYGDYRAHGKKSADAMLKLVKNLPITIIPEMTDGVFLEAGRLKATYKMSLADAVVLAEASVGGGAVLTADHHEFDVVEQNEKIEFAWIR